MVDPPVSERPVAPPPWRPRFTLKALFLVTFVCCAIGTAAAYLVRSTHGGGRIDRFSFILFTLAAPALLLVAVSIAAQLFVRPRRRK